MLKLARNLSDEFVPVNGDQALKTVLCAIPTDFFPINENVLHILILIIIIIKAKYKLLQ